MPSFPTLALYASLPTRHCCNISSQIVCLRIWWSSPILHFAMSLNHSTMVPHICSLNVSRDDRIVTVTLICSMIFAFLMSSWRSRECSITVLPISFASSAFARPNLAFCRQALVTWSPTSWMVCFSSFHSMRQYSGSGSNPSPSPYHFDPSLLQSVSCWMFSTVFEPRKFSGEHDTTSQK